MCWLDKALADASRPLPRRLFGMWGVRKDEESNVNIPREHRSGRIAGEEEWRCGSNYEPIVVMVNRTSVPHEVHTCQNNGCVHVS